MPLEFFLVGTGLALAISFVALAVLWPEPRLQDGPAERSINSPWVTWFTRILGFVGIAGLVLVLLAGLAGREDRNNAAPVLIWVYFWLVIPFLSVLFGNLWHWINPYRTLAEAAKIGEEEKPRLLERWGVWPALIAFVAFTWLELVWRSSADPQHLAVAAIVYTVYVLDLVYYAGRRSGIESGDAFNVFSGLIGAIAPIGPDEEGGMMRRGWLRALPVIRARPGLTPFVIAMIGTVTYDGLSSTAAWEDLFGDNAGTMWAGTIGLLGCIAALGALYWVASAAAAWLGESEMTAVQVANSFAHTLVPIALAYAFAHYFSLVIFEGQLIAGVVSDPLGLDWDLFGTAGHRVNFFLSPTTVWWVQVATIVTGHVTAVVLAHDRALAIFNKRSAVRSQYAMLVLMIALTGLGLVLLSAG